MCLENVFCLAVLGTVINRECAALCAVMEKQSPTIKNKFKNNIFGQIV
jgi:hypothetical protein